MVDRDQLLEQISSELQQHADESYRMLVRDRYRMSVDNFWGVRMPLIHRIANAAYARIKHVSIDQRLAYCQHFLDTGIYEHKIVAFRWGYRCRRDYHETHFDELVRWLATYVNDWIDCDDLCIHVLGEFLLRYPQQAPGVTAWTTAPNRWLRRGAAVALVLPARKGQQLDLVLTVAGLLLHDTDDLVQKGYGWLLKEASKTHPQAIFSFVQQHRHTMPRTAFRYALEKLPPELRQAAMRKE